MASFTLTSDRFPEGTSVGAYPCSNWLTSQRPPSGAAQGSATATATVTNGVATFSGLADDTAYYAGASVSGTWRYVGFRTAAASASASSGTGVQAILPSAAPGAAVQAAITALGLAGGEIALWPGSYTWESIPQIPANLTGQLKIRALGQVTVTLTAGAPRFLDFVDTVAESTLRNVEIDGHGLTIDCASIGGSHHVVIGTLKNGTIATRVNIDNIWVHHVTTINVPTVGTNGSPGQGRRNVNLVVWHTAAGQAINTVTDVTVEDCDFGGGNYGVGIFAQSSGFDINVYYDRIYVRRNRWVMASVPTFFNFCAGVHICGSGWGDKCVVEDNYSENSGDINIEVDGMHSATIARNKGKNAYSGDILVVNFNDTPDKAKQVFRIFENDYEHDGTVADHQPVYVTIGDVNGTHALGEVIVRGGTYKRVGGQPASNTELVKGQWGNGQYPRAVTVEGLVYDIAPADYAGGSAIVPSLFSFSNHASTTGESKITIRRTRGRYVGSKSGAGSMTVSGVIFTQPLYEVDIDSNVFQIAVTGGITKVIETSGNAAGTLRGRIVNNRVLAGDAGETGQKFIQFRAASIYAGKLLVQGNDLTSMLTTAWANVMAGTLGATVLLRDNKYAAVTVFPAAATISTTSGTGVQITDGHDGFVTVAGGTVSLVEWSAENTTYFTVAAGTNVLVPVRNGDYIRVTYTVAPTVKKSLTR